MGNNMNKVRLPEGGRGFIPKWTCRSHRSFLSELWLKRSIRALSLEDDSSVSLNRVR